MQDTYKIVEVKQYAVMQWQPEQKKATCLAYCEKLEKAEEFIAKQHESKLVDN